MGRARELEQIYTLFGDGASSESLVVLQGEAGVGKSRLARTAAAEAKRRDWQVAWGRAYPVETGAPYALFSDAFLPLMTELGEASLTVLSRGHLSELGCLFPALGAEDGGAFDGGAGREPSIRLHWAFTQFVRRLGERAPLLIVLDDVHWADPFSLALLHFLVRNLADEPVRVICTWATKHRRSVLHEMERSFLALRKVRVLPLQPLSRDSTHELVEKAFGAAGPHVSEFARALFHWTRGNAYLIEQMLVALVDSGRFQRRDGTWLGWELGPMELPPAIRSATHMRTRGLSKDARRVATLLAVARGPVPCPLLVEVSGLPLSRVVAGVEDLLERTLVEERLVRGRVLLDLRHPLVRESLYRRLTLTRRCALHRSMAEGLERLYGDGAMKQAQELAHHIARGGAPRHDSRTVRYLTAAGRGALRRHADREAVEYLEMAAAMLPDEGERGTTEGPGPGGAELDVPAKVAVAAGLARARARLGQYEEAGALWHGILQVAHAGGDPIERAEAYRHLGLAAFHAMGHDRAVSRFRDGLEALGDHAPELGARLHISAGLALHALGRQAGSQAELRRALAIATDLGDEALLARAHRALAVVLCLTEDGAKAVAHGRKAVSLADRAGEALLAFQARWPLAVLAYLTGGPRALDPVLAELRGRAEQLAAPDPRLWVSQLEVERSWASGEWRRGIAQGEHAIVRAKKLNRTPLTVELLACTARCYLGLGDLDRGGELVQEAWGLAGPGDGTEGRPQDVHATFTASAARVALLNVRGRYREALRVGKEAVALADGAGLVRLSRCLLPLLLEAQVQVGRMGDAARTVERLRGGGSLPEDEVARARADLGDGLVSSRAGGVGDPGALVRRAAEALEGLGLVPEAARARRLLAEVLADLDDRDEALEQLRIAYRVWGRLGARPELAGARAMFRELDSRPPSRGRGGGTAALTDREVEVARMVAARRSNVAVGKALGISHRTVSTHLSNIYRKLDIGSRGELVDMVREGRLSIRSQARHPAGR